MDESGEELGQYTPRNMVLQGFLFIPTRKIMHLRVIEVKWTELISVITSLSCVPLFSGYPNDFSLPPTGVQRGSAKSGTLGDPSTPGYPSLKSAYRTPNEEITDFPVLPLQPIAYEDAESLIKM